MQESGGTPEVPVHLKEHWLGLGLSEQKLPDLLHGLSKQIDQAWEEVNGGKEINDLFDFVLYRQVAGKMPQLAVKAQQLALQWVKSPDPALHQEGIKILLHVNLSTVINIVDRFSKLGLAEDELLERSMLSCISTVGNLKPEASGDINQKINKNAKYTCEEASAEYLDFPVSWLRKGYVQKIPAWIGEFHFQHGYLPSAAEIAQEFGINEPEVEYQLKEGILAVGKATKESIVYGEQEALRSADLAVLSQTVGQIIESFPPREQKVIRMLFGLEPYDQSYSLEEVGKEVGVTRVRIRKVKAIALRRLRLPRISSKLKDFAEDL